MGRETFTADIDISEASTVSEAVQRALDEWRDSNPSRFASVYMRERTVHKVMSEQVAAAIIDTPLAPVTDEQYVVIPYHADADATVTTERARLTVADAKELHEALVNPHALLRLARAAFGANITSAEVQGGGGPMPAVANSTAGEAETRHLIIDSNGQDVHRGKRSYGTQEEATQAALDLMVKYPGLYTLSVRAFVARQDGTADLVTITRSVPETLHLDVVLRRTVSNPGAKYAGWIVAFNFDNN